MDDSGVGLHTEPTEVRAKGTRDCEEMTTNLARQQLIIPLFN